MSTGKWLLAVIVATGVMFTPYSGVTAAEGVSTQGIAAKNSETKKLADLDEKIVETLKNTLQELAGEDVELKEEVVIYDGIIFIRTKEERRGIVQVNQKTGKVERASIGVSLNKIDPKQLELAKNSLKEIDSKLAFEVKEVKKMIGSDYKPGGLVSTSIIGENFGIGLHGDKVVKITIRYPKSMWDAEIKKKAEREFKAATGRTMTIEDIGRVKDDKMDIWTIASENSQSSVYIGVKTGKVWSISDAKAVGKTDKAILTEKNAVSYASAFAKKAFNIDLKGYTAKKVPNFPVYELTKKGAPTIEVSFNSKKGVISMSIKPVNRVWN
ncbi:hypothetical protein [Paenibacillus agilis]|uniref:PepSY domain-containing protein n=1 Tax=Paenibacillus agilis TaxID=3020863 RepID=A0A559J2E3_9BACL|nr:hypothetical protein [Paenibacillus agilis]TVX94033.1 hypothetical protein FPZ44_13795 [Paenibacillus agilis]